MIRHLSIFLFCVFHFSHLSTAQNKLPIEAFASLPSFAQPNLSPSGSKIAFMTEREGHRSVIILDMKTQQSVIIPKFGDSEVTSFRWANEEVVLLEFGVQDTRPGGQFFTYKNRNFSYNLNTGEFLWLENPQSTGSYRDQQTYSGTFLHSLPNDEDHVLMQMPGVSWFDAYKVNVYTGKKKRVKRGKRGVERWYTDYDGAVRFGAGFYRHVSSPGSEKLTAYLVEKDNSVTDVKDAEWFEDYIIEGFTRDPDILYVSGETDFGTQGIFKLNIRSGEILESVYAHETYDVGGIIYDSDTGNIVGVYYTDDTQKNIYFDQKYAKIQRSLKKALKSENIYLVSKARNADIYLVLNDSPANPGDYYLYNRTSGTLDYLAPRMDGIYPEEMTPAQRITYTARDGVNVPAYLTLPKGNTKKLPTIILPHGGPNSRDTQDWDFWSQFYANRGYAVIQPNFRGSTGYGTEYYEAGHLQWGGLMQDDVTDATLWMVKEGYADKDKICIVGASYGGYAALYGVIKEPDLYQCSISVNGVTDIPELRRGDKRKAGAKEWLSYMGLEGKPETYISPYHRAKDINVPVLLISSVDDLRVPYKMSIHMDEKLGKLGKDTTYIKLEDGGHSMLTRKSRLIMLTETEKFLAEHIGN